MSYVNTEAVIDYISPGHLCSPEEKRYSESDIVEILNIFKKNDVTKVVRCKDCVHYTESTYFSGGDCDRWAVPTIRHGDDFCSDGVRKREGRI